MNHLIPPKADFLQMIREGYFLPFEEAEISSYLVEGGPSTGRRWNRPTTYVPPPSTDPLLVAVNGVVASYYRADRANRIFFWEELATRLDQHAWFAYWQHNYNRKSVVEDWIQWREQRGSPVT